MPSLVQDLCRRQWQETCSHLRNNTASRRPPRVRHVFFHYGDIVHGVGDKDKVTTLVSKDRSTGMLLGNIYETKGPSDKWVIKKYIKNIELNGRSNIPVKTDGNPSIAAVQGTISGRDGQTVLGNPTANNPEPHGPSEKGVQDFNSLLRRLKLALEARLRHTIRVKSPVMEWTKGSG